MAKKKSAEAPESIGGFRGFGSQALPFLRALSENNDRDWFAENKATFLEECDTPLRELVREVGIKLEVVGNPFAPNPRNSVFRIYRDVRFSKDKNPYKINVGAALYREGDKTQPGLLYIHVEPDRSFIAAGIYHPEPPLLKAIRSSIVDDPPRFTQVVRTLASKQLEMRDEDALSRMPKGFEAFADAPFAASLRHRSFIVRRPLADDDLERRDLPEVVVRFAEDARPLLDFFWERVAIEEKN